MRAWLEALEDKSLPSLKIADAEGEVAAAFKVSIKSNGESARGKEKLVELALPKYCDEWRERWSGRQRHQAEGLRASIVIFNSRAS